MIAIGNIIGDYCGSIYEWHNPHVKAPFEVEILKDKSFFTDDSILSCALMEWLNKTGGSDQNYLKECLIKWGNKYPDGGYGSRFKLWLISNGESSNNSFGNGSAMRVAPCAYYANTIEECLELAKKSAEITHNHEEGIKGAQAIAEAIYLARCGASKAGIKNAIEKDFGYDLNKSINEIGQNAHGFDATCQVTVPEALICFLNSENYVDCIQQSIWIGGDVDTIAAMSGGIAEAFYGIPYYIIEKAKENFDNNFKETIIEFNKTLLDR